MAKKKSRKRVIKTIVPKVATVFDCPFCNHKKSVEVKMDKKKSIADISCRVCSASYRIKSNSLTEPIDVYCEWIDEADRINKEKEGEN